MKNKLFLIGMFALNAKDSREESNTHYSAVVEMLKGNVAQYSETQKTQMLNHALYLDNKYIELEHKKFEFSKENTEKTEKQHEEQYKDSLKSRNVDRIFLWGLVGVLTIYIIYKGTTDSKQNVEI